VEWKDRKPGVRLKGKIVRLEPFGAFVEIGTDRPGLVHVSEMSAEYVRDPGEIVKVGDEVDVAVVELNPKKRQIRLTMKVSEPEAPEEAQEAPEVSMTPMERALRQAMAEDTSSDRSTARPGPARPSRDDQEDIISRTLKSRMQASSSERKP